MPLTREEERLRKRAYRERKRQEAAASVTKPPKVPGGPAGGGTVLEMVPKPEPVPEPSTEVQDGVRAELEQLAASSTHPGLVAAALAMARILDDPKSVPQHPGAARSLDGLLLRLHDANKGRGGGKLAAMRQARGAS